MRSARVSPSTISSTSARTPSASSRHFAHAAGAEGSDDVVGTEARADHHFTGTSSFNVSRQFCATIAAVLAASLSTGRRIMTNRPSGITSYVRQPKS